MEPSTSSSNGGGGTSELFICFTSRISSMKKLTSSSNSKSLLSPARSSQISLSSSLSRRLRSSASLRGGASPMFPAGKKRSGAAAFENNPEPSSPKVTCIGQVRVKSKSKAKKKHQSSNNNAAVARCRRSLSGEASFRRSERERTSGRRWVTMCDALRLSCLVPSCRSGNNNSKKKEEEGRSCGAVLARWLVADGKGGRREIELAMAAEEPSEKRDQREEEEEEEEEEDRVVVVERSGSLKRRVLEGIEFREFAADRDDIGGGGQKARVSLCVPPKNALLLMRCRSDPVKMAALASRFYDCDDDDDEIINQSSNNNNNVRYEEEDEDSEVEQEPDLVKEEATDMLVVDEEKEENETEKIEEEEEEEMVDEMQAVVIMDELSTDQPNPILEEEEEEEDNMFRLLYEEEEEEEEEEEDDVAVIEAPEAIKEDEETERDCRDEEEKERESDTLPDCLLLMMCEPKLSMEVSKETWIRTTDFVRWLPERRRNNNTNNKKPIITKAALPPKPPSAGVLLQPPRSSCSAVAGAGAKPYEPFLSRCKSEPRKSPVTVQPPEPFWKNRKLDSGHHRASAGVGV